MSNASLELRLFKNLLKVESMTDKVFIEINIFEKQLRHILWA